MELRVLGRTELRVSAVSFGAGPVSGLMTGNDRDAQLATVATAIEVGINWFDTAPGYGQGSSETNLGQVLTELRSSDSVHVATKVRLPAECDSVDDFIRRSVEESLGRLKLPRVTLLQVHNGLTAQRNDEPSSIAPADAFAMLTTFRRLQSEGLVRFIGLTGTGHSDALSEVVRSGEFDTIQAPYNLLDRGAGDDLFIECSAQGMGVFAIRVFAGGALLNQPPSAHTLKTPYFPLALYERDALRAQQIGATLSKRSAMAEHAIRFSLSHSAVASAIIGFGSPEHVREIETIERPA